MYKIYKYTNKNNGKVYIGQTSKTLQERALSNGSNYKESPRFYNAIKKYGWDSFIPEIIEDNLTVDEANQKECYYISLYNSTNPTFGYNILFGGNNSRVPDSAKKIISQKAKERYKDKRNNPMFGKHHSKESIEKMSLSKIGRKNPMYGTHWNETQKKFCGTKGKTLNLTSDHRKQLIERARNLGFSNAKKIRCIEDNIIFDSLTKAANYYSVNPATLCGQLNGRQKTCKGRHFEYFSS